MILKRDLMFLSNFNRYSNFHEFYLLLYVLLLFTDIEEKQYLFLNNQEIQLNIIEVRKI